MPELNVTVAPGAEVIVIPGADLLVPVNPL
jgi:hypothetical protein